MSRDVFSFSCFHKGAALAVQEQMTMKSFRVPHRQQKQWAWGIHTGSAHQSQQLFLECILNKFRTMYTNFGNNAISLPENTSGSFQKIETIVSANFSLSISVLSVFHKMVSDVNCYNLLPQLVEISVVGYNSNNNKTK